MKMEILIYILITIAVGVGGFFGGWFAKPPQALITDINNKTTVEVISKTEVSTTSILSTEVYNFPEKVWGSCITNTNMISNFINSVVSNTNSFISTTNKKYTNIIK